MLNLFTPAAEAQYVRTISARSPDAESSRLSLAGISISVSPVVLASAVPAREPAPEPADTGASKIAVGVSAGSAGTPHSTPGGRRRNKIIFLAMTLARLTIRCFFRPLVADPVAPALRLPLLLATRGLTVAMLRLPLPPPLGLLSALWAAVARHRVDGAEHPFASLQ
jgi:hypothetical protein